MITPGHRCVLNGGDYDTSEVYLTEIVDRLVMPDVDANLDQLSRRQTYDLKRDDAGAPLLDVAGRVLYQWAWRTDEPPVQTSRSVPPHRTSPAQAPRPPQPRPSRTGP